jgi:hypothetical protein
MFYALLLLGSGFNFMISGYDSAKREKAKTWLRNVLIMIVLVQASFFIYQLAIELSASATSAMLTLINQNFFLIGLNSISDLGMAIFFGLFYLCTLIVTSLVLVIRYAFVAIGVVLFPIGIFLYFMPALKQYGSLILNFLGIAIFVTIFDAILLAGFSQLVTLPVFENMRIIVVIAAFGIITVVMILLFFFGIVKSAFSVYNEVKRWKV